MIPFTSIERSADATWTWTWDSTDAAYYRIILQGKEIDRTPSTSYSLHHQAYKAAPPPIEAVSESEKALSEINPPSYTIQWNRVTGAVSYLVEKQAGASWTPEANYADNGESRLLHESSTVEDGETVVLRVRARDAQGNYSSPLSFSKTIICHPEIDDNPVEASYTPGLITVDFADA